MIGEAALVLSLGVCLYLYLRPARVSGLPPTIPVPKAQGRRWLHYTETAKQYGEITSFVEDGKVTVVLNSAEIATELLERRSANYSSRPPMHLLSVARKAAMGGWAPYNAAWKKWYKIVHNALMAKAAHSYRPWQQLESAVMLERVANQPEAWSRAVREFATCVSTQISYGYRPKDVTNDPLLDRNTLAEDTEQKLALNHSIVERWPILRYAPSFAIPLLKEARQALQRDTAFFTSLFDAVRKRMDTGSPPWSFARDIHSQPLSSYGISYEELAFAAAIPLSTGIFTVSALLRVFAMACAAQGSTFLPRAKAELDAVVGEERLPTFDDLSSLPFLAAIGKELQRWGRIAPLALPHATMKADTVASNGHVYQIPKGATVLLNNFAISWDAVWYPEPDRFKPQRFLEERRPFPTQIGHFGFGAGRRLCPGMHVAEAAYLIIISRLVWAFDIVATGPVDMSESNFEDHGIGRVPHDIPVEFKIRSEKHRRLIKEEFRIASIELEQCETI